MIMDTVNLNKINPTGFLVFIVLVHNGLRITNYIPTECFSLALVDDNYFIPFLI